MIPWDRATLSVCDILGFDPLHMAGGCAADAVSGEDPDRALGATESPRPRREGLCNWPCDRHQGMVGIQDSLRGNTSG